MQIQSLARQTGVSTKTIRYYEQIGILPPPARSPNGYRQYAPADMDRLQLVAGARRLDISLAEIKEILEMKDQNQAPCTRLLDVLGQKEKEIHTRIQELQRMEIELHSLQSLGRTFPTDDVAGKNCVCHLVSQPQA